MAALTKMNVDWNTLSGLLSSFIYLFILLLLINSLYIYLMTALTKMNVVFFFCFFFFSTVPIFSFFFSWNVDPLIFIYIFIFSILYGPTWVGFFMHLAPLELDSSCILPFLIAFSDVFCFSHCFQFPFKSGAYSFRKISLYLIRFVWLSLIFPKIDYNLMNIKSYQLIFVFVCVHPHKMD